MNVPNSRIGTVWNGKTVRHFGTRRWNLWKHKTPRFSYLLTEIVYTPAVYGHFLTKSTEIHITYLSGVLFFPVISFYSFFMLFFFFRRQSDHHQHVGRRRSGRRWERSTLVSNRRVPVGPGTHELDPSGFPVREESQNVNTAQEQHVVPDHLKRDQIRQRTVLLRR